MAQDIASLVQKYKDNLLKIYLSFLKDETPPIPPDEFLDKAIKEQKLPPISEQQLEKIRDELLTSNKEPWDAMGFSHQFLDWYYNATRKFYEAGKYDVAIAGFFHLTALEPSNPLYRFALAAAHHLNKNYIEATWQYRLAYLMDLSNPLPLYYASDCFLKIHDFLNAQISLQELVKTFEEISKHKKLVERAKQILQSIDKELKK